MKTSSLLKRKLPKLLGTPVSLGLVILATGCAGDRYSRSTGESIDDRALTSRVKGALHDDAVYKYPDVSVATFKGRVQLSGFVDTKEQRAQAEELAKRVAGETEVENKISVKP